ncbi:unnamed protein product [Miscanthus lutarioriparius]|uniref:RIN4 pathogenic type III effector avirulence factor Avr cleavage site domain-containing protein n=1 Tax=Miscanthus lutarioriparius TaxID=422564 RepID=A0A811SIH2_9POAL|nr:unnamed protein product [Miscanthus lutarioriparius]
MAKQTEVRARPAAATATSAASARPPRASVPAFGGWEVAGGAGAAAPDYSLDFTNIRAARMQQRRKALSWSSFVGNAAVAVETPGCGGGGVEDEKPRQWSSAATSGADDDDDDDDRERRRRHQLRRLRSADDDRQPIQPGRAAPKGRSKFKGYLFGCVSGQW